MTEKLAGIISALDEAYLDELIDSNPAVNEIWILMQSTISSKRRGSFKILLGKPKFRKLFAAAVFTIVILTSSYFFRYLSQTSKKYLNKIEILNNASLVKLTLSNGNVINLSAAPDTLEIGNLRLSTKNKTLLLSSNTALPAGINTVTVPIGQTYSIVLPDGSKVWLNSATEIKFPTFFGSTTREITVKGEAYLEVASNASKLFVVNAGYSKIQVLGTAFNVNNYDEAAVKVSLISGSVKVKNDIVNQQIKPGQQVIISPDKSILVKEFDIEREVTWREGICYFTDASLEDICKIIPRWFGNRVEINKETVGERHFTGRMQRNLPVVHFLETLRITTDIQYHIDEEGVIHLR